MEKKKEIPRLKKKVAVKERPKAVKAKTVKKAVVKAALHKPAKTVKVAPKKRVKKEIVPEHQQVVAAAVKEPAPTQERPLAASSKPLAQKPAVEKSTPTHEERPAQEFKAAVIQPEVEKPGKILELDLPVTVKDLAIKLQEKPSLLIKAFMGMGVMVGINQTLEEPAVVTICQKYGYQLKKAPEKEEYSLRQHYQVDDSAFLKPRAPIVTFMGHVDHGKTSLLDAIRKTKVAESEHGGITQHIGAYRAKLDKGEITFLDTPGHEAFTAMRARGAKITDIVVLVVAADDGIMPQTQEAIDHARAAGVPIVVAVNKVDKPQADIDRVKKQLSGVDLMSEDWGGKTITVPVSAKTGQGIDALLEMIILEAQMLELKANPNRQAKGVVIEAKMSKGRGPVATLLVENGTLHLNDVILVDKYSGKIKSMLDDHGRSVNEALPSVAVEVSGISGIPDVGEQFFALADEKLARDLAHSRQEKEKQREIKTIKKISLEDLYSQIKEGKLKDLRLVVKADVQGSLEAVKEILSKLDISEIKLNILHGGVGNINTSDIMLAVVSDALVLGFNVVVEDKAKELEVKEGVDVRIYNVIYELFNDIKAALEGILEPKTKKVFLGKVEIRKVFDLSRSGKVAGCFVVKGKITRQAGVRLIRNGEAVYEGNLSSLKRFKDDVKEVMEGFDCGITFAGFNDYNEGDVIEAYVIEKIARKL